MIGWLVFGVLVLGLLSLDLLVFHRKSHEIGVREALAWSGVWIGLALAFAVGVYFAKGHVAATEFITAYLIEESLSVDNLFVFLVLFSHFAVPAPYRHKVLFWGILGALIMRFAFIAAGVSLIERFQWVLYVFGAILLVSGFNLLREREKEVHPERNWVLRGFRRVFPVTTDYEGDRFFVRRAGRLFATPLFIVLLAVETTDLVFAVDSIPAALGISRDPFIVYTSNVFAILGLRSLFFAIVRLLDVFHLLHYGLALILMFVGVKMLIEAWIHVPTIVALGVVIGTLAVSIAASMIWPAKAPATKP